MPRQPKLTEAEDIVKELVEEARQKKLTNKQFKEELKVNKSLNKEVKDTVKLLKEQLKTYDSIEKKTKQFVNSLEKSKKLVKDDKFYSQVALDIKNRTLSVLRDITSTNEKINRNDIDSKKLKESILKNQVTLNALKTQENRESRLFLSTTKDIFSLLSSSPAVSLISSSEIDMVDKYGDKRLALEKKLSQAVSPTSKVKIQLDIDQLDSDYGDIIERIQNLSIIKPADLDILNDYNSKINKLQADIRKLTDPAKISTKNNQIAALKADLKYQQAQNDVRMASMLQPTAEALQIELKQQIAVSATIRAIHGERDAIAEANEQWRLQYDEVERVTDRIGLVGKIADTMKSSKFGRIFDLDEVSEAMKAAGKQKSSSGFDIAKAGFNAFKSGTAFKAGLQGLAIKGGIKLFDFMVESMFKADKRVTDLAKSFGVAKNEAQGMYDMFESRMESGIAVGLNMDDLIGAQLKFNETFGTAIILSRDLNTSLARAAKLIGLSEEAQRGLAENSVVMGEDASAYQNTILGTSKIIQMRNGLFLNDKKVLENVLKITGGMRANFKGSVEEMTKAVTKAMQLGVSLEQVGKFGESLLDWESSINAELEAELVTGKQLNMERARAYALTGDMVGLTDEMVNQLGSVDEFFKMNVIQQKKLAEAFGMSRDEASDMLYQKAFMEKMQTMKISEKDREMLGADEKMRAKYIAIMNKTNITEAERAKLLGEEVTHNLSQLSAQQKFEEAMTRLKEKIAQIFGNGAILDKLADGVIKFLRMFGLADPSMKTTDEITEENMVNDPKLDQHTRDRYKEKLRLDQQVADGWLGGSQEKENNFVLEKLNYILHGLNPFGLGSGREEYQKQAESKTDEQARPRKVSDSLINPSGGIKISTPKGMIIPDANDHLVTTTDPDGLLSGKTGGSVGTSLDMRLVVEEIKKLRQETQQNTNMLATVFRENKDVYMDSTKVSSGLKNSSYK